MKLVPKIPPKFPTIVVKQMIVPLKEYNIICRIKTVKNIHLRLIGNNSTIHAFMTGITIPADTNTTKQYMAID